MATLVSLSDYDKNNIPDVSGLRFGIVVSEWNSNITSSLLEGAQSTLLAHGAMPKNILTWNVPGSFELTFGCKKMAATESLDAIIAIGCIIQGETKHFDYVCQSVSFGITSLNTVQNTPVIFCVLTDNTLEQSLARSGGKHGNKGVEAAVSAIKMAFLGR